MCQGKPRALHHVYMHMALLQQRFITPQDALGIEKKGMNAWRKILPISRTKNSDGGG
jgi:hypothetical protein